MICAQEQCTTQSLTKPSHSIAQGLETTRVKAECQKRGQVSCLGQSSHTLLRVRALICARLAEGSGVRRNKGGRNAVALPELTVKAAMS